jgi:hypothetical protein
VVDVIIVTKVMSANQVIDRKTTITTKMIFPHSDDLVNAPIMTMVTSRHLGLDRLRLLIDIHNTGLSC